MDLAHRDAAKQTGVDVQRAAVKEAQTKVDTTRQTIANLTLRAPTSGYVQLAENTNGLSVLFYGMQVPTFQLGDSARPGQIVAQIPDMSSWEVSTQIPETDRAFLAVGQRAIVRPKAMPGQEFAGHISLLGGSAGSAWNRTFNCRIALDDADEALRPGLSVDVVIRVETLDECPVGPVPGGVRARGTLVRLSTGARGLRLASGHDGPPHREPGRGHRHRSRRDHRPGGTGPADAQHAVGRSARSARQMRILTDLLQAFDNLRAQKTRTLLTTSGIVFGVGSVIGMMAIGAGAREETLRFIEQLGVRNILVDSLPASSSQEMQQRRQSSPGLTQRDARILRTNIDAIEAMSVRKTMRPATLLPKPSQDPPEIYGVEAAYSQIHSLRLAEGGFFDDWADQTSAAVAVLGETAKVSLLGYEPALGKFIKVDGTWLEVVGVLEEQLAQNPRREQRRDAGREQRHLHPDQHVPVSLPGSRRRAEGRARGRGPAGGRPGRTASKWPRW